MFGPKELRHANGILNLDFVFLAGPGFACGIACVQVEGIETPALQQWLWRQHRIYTTPIGHAEFNGLRISPSVYSTLEEIDRFSEAMEWALRHGLPA